MRFPLLLAAMLIAPAAHAGNSLSLDQDGDGYNVIDLPNRPADCDDNDPDTYPGAPELCDGKDNNCNRAIAYWEEDHDGDGVMGCEGDCDDHDPGVSPDRVELCDGKDNDCDGEIDLHWTVPDLRTDDGNTRMTPNGIAGTDSDDIGRGNQLWVMGAGSINTVTDGSNPVWGDSGALLSNRTFAADQPLCLSAEFSVSATSFDGMTLGFLDADRVSDSVNWASDGGYGGSGLGVSCIDGNTTQDEPLGVVMKLDREFSGSERDPYGHPGVSVVAPDQLHFDEVADLWDVDEIPVDEIRNWIDYADRDEAPQLNQVVFGWDPYAPGQARIDAYVDLASDSQGGRSTTRWVSDPNSGRFDDFRLAVTASNYGNGWAQVGITEMHLVCLPCPDELDFPALPKPPEREVRFEELGPDEMIVLRPWD